MGYNNVIEASIRQHYSKYYPAKTLINLFQNVLEICKKYGPKNPNNTKYSAKIYFVIPHIDSNLYDTNIKKPIINFEMKNAWL